MFFAKNEYGHEALKTAFDQLPIDPARRVKLTASFLGIAESTLKNYLSGRADPPRAVCYALWHESPLGRAATSAHSEHGAALWRSLAKSKDESIKRLEATIDKLTAELDHVKRHQATPKHTACNDPVYRYR